MKLTTYEILEANNGLPALVQALLQRGEVQRALQLGKLIHQLRPEVEVFQLNQNALIQAYGDMDREQRQRVVMAGSEKFARYEDAYRALLAQEHDLDVKRFKVSAEELMALASNPQAVIAIGAVVEVRDAPDDGDAPDPPEEA